MHGMSDAAPSQQDIADGFRRALAVAAECVGATAPNPPVGCAILDVRGHVLACAAHQKAGMPHAEAAALELCRCSGQTHLIHTIIVTLEPCNHTGRTGPCTEAILDTPAQAVWIGAEDPNPKVRGGGAKRLRAAGLAVHGIADLDHPDAPVLAQECRELIAPFAKCSRTGLPWVTVKQALDVRGGMIPPPGQKTFTNAAALTQAHAMRKRADAILTGSGTILADAPEFTVRHMPDHFGKQRWLVILDRRGRVPHAYIRTAEARGFKVRIAADITGALAFLGEQGVLEVLVEAGPQVLDSILSGGFADAHIVIHQQEELPCHP